MEIEGAIDSIAIEPDGRLVVAGWASAGPAGQREPVDTILLQGIDRAELRFHARSDFDGADNRFGFGLILDHRADLARLRSGESAAFAIKQGKRFRLPIWPMLDDQIAQLVAEAKPLVKASTAPTGKPPPAPFVNLAGETATHAIEVGFTSHDRTIVVGREGHFFLVGGSNAVEEPAVLVDAWLRVIRERARRFAAMGVRFAQMIVPEKQSVLRHAFPGDIPTPSPTLLGIMDDLAGEPWFIDSLAWLSDVVAQEGLDPYRKIDTQFAFPGARALARALVHHATGVVPGFEHPPLTVTRLPGDLGSKLGHGRVMEETLWPVIADWPFARTPIELVRAVDPPDGGHVGCIREWRCATPSIDQTLLIFGNSFFGRDVDPSALCWWASRTFRRTVFHWSADVDWAVVEAERPDLVVCQTIERFLSAVPNA